MNFKTQLGIEHVPTDVAMASAFIRKYLGIIELMNNECYKRDSDVKSSFGYS